MFLLHIAGLCAKFDVLVTVTSCSHVMYYVEVRLHDVTLEDRWSFLCDTQRLDLAVHTYGNYNTLACQ